MTVGLADAFALSVLDCLCNATNITAPTGFFVKLHLGDPGAAGATSPAVEATRQSASMAAAVTGGTITNDTAVTWTNVSTTETVSHVSFWSASTAGTFLGSDDLAVARALTAGDTFTIAIGDLDIALTPIAA